MTAFSDKMARDMKKIFARMGTTFDWKKKKEIKCTVTYGFGGSEVVDMGGLMDESNITITTLALYFSEAEGQPKEKQTVTVNGVKFQIDGEPLIQAGTPMLIMRCAKPDLNRGNEMNENYF